MIAGPHRPTGEHAVRYWLMKSEPEEFSIDDLEGVRREPWDGVRNYQARNFMRDQMRVGDGVLFYHSNCKPPGITGIARVASTPYPDPTQFDPDSPYFDPKSDPQQPRWMLVDVEFERKLRRMITLPELRDCAELEDFALVRRGNRLSVMPVEPQYWQTILAME